MRADKRRYDECREISTTTGFCITSQGSARMKFGRTEVIVNIIGPKELRYREVDTGLAHIHVKTYPEMHELNDIIQTAVKNSLDLSAYPDSSIDVSITIICNDGSLACCAINTAILALKDAQLKLTHRISASCFTFKGKDLYVDPSKHEEEVADGVVTFVYSHEDQKVFSCFFEGNVDPAMMLLAMERATYNQEIMLPFFE